MGGRPKEYLSTFGEQWPHSMWKWLGKLFPSHGASRILDSSIPSSRMDLRKATMLRKSPKDLLPNGGRFMDESHGTINPFKKTKIQENKTVQQNHPILTANTSKTQGTYGCGSGFFSTSHPTIPSPHQPKSSSGPPPKSPLAMLVPHHRSQLQLEGWRSTDPPRLLGKEYNFRGPIVSGNLMNGYPKMMGLGKGISAISGIYVKFQVCRPTGMFA